MSHRYPMPSRRGEIEPFLVMDVMRAAADREQAGERIIHMEVGQPGASAPAAAVAAAKRALADGKIGYSEALGRRDLRARISQYYREAHDLDVTPDRIAVTTGSSAGFNLTFLAAFDPGARIALSSPGYPAYRNSMHALGLEAVDIPLGGSLGHVLTPDLLRAEHARKPLDGVLVASPANPTGTLMSPAELKALAEVAEELELVFISDEIYHRLVHVGEESSALQFSDAAIVVNSFSKYYCMTGWRIGWVVVPQTLVRTIERLAQNLYISAPGISQRAALGAFEATAELDQVKAVYAASRQMLLDRLPRMGFEDFSPCDGGFYVYASIRRFSNDSLDFSRRMLAEAGVAATSGLDFDRQRGAGTMRFSFAGTEEHMAEAMDRLAVWLG
jgi:aspartate/methionine/tyrosine aminotransferase